MSSVRYLPLVDTHAHINLQNFKLDLEDLLERCRQGRFPSVKGRQVDDPILKPFIAGVVCPGVDLASSLEAIELSKRYSFIFAAIGFHPNHTTMMEQDDWEKYEKLVNTSVNNRAHNLPQSLTGRIVALGETGLDRYWNDAPFDIQRKYFLKTLKLGVRVQLPVIIHSREANDDVMELLRAFYVKNNCSKIERIGVIHSYNGTLEQAQELVEMGFYLGFGGFVTYTNKKFSELWEVAKQIPNDRILLETDCPFLTPHPLRGKIERNEPLTTAFVARRLAELRNVSTTEIVNQTRQNAIHLFDLPQLAEEPTKL